MYNTKKITDKIYFIGASDRTLPRFENLHLIPNGMAYNSYVIMDEKIAILDTADSSVSDRYIENLEHILKDRTPDYLVIHHMEPDHCINIKELCNTYKQLTIVTSKKASEMINRFFEEDLSDRMILVSDNDVLELGEHKLTFMTAPMVHWPEVLYSYESISKILFAADAFGSFGALNGNIFSKDVDFNEEKISEYRRYYTNICGRFGTQVAASLKKAARFDIQMICPLHGYIINTDEMGILFDRYNKWSSYTPENPQAVMIVYGSMYGNTANAANTLAHHLANEGVHDITVFDVSATNLSYLISEAFRVGHIVVASVTYNLSIYRPIKDFLEDLIHLNMQNRGFSVIENGFWSWGAGNKMKALIDEMKNCEVVGDIVKIPSSVDKQCRDDLKSLAHEIKTHLNIGE